MIEAIAAVLFCQLLGEAIARGLALPVPGPVIGLVILFLALVVRGRLTSDAPDPDQTPIGAFAGVLLAHLSLLFVPAGVGIVGQSDVIMRHGFGLLLALVISTAAALAATGLVFRWAEARFSPRDPVEPEP